MSVIMRFPCTTTTTSCLLSDDGVTLNDDDHDNNIININTSATHQSRSIRAPPRPRRAVSLASVYASPAKPVLAGVYAMPAPRASEPGLLPISVGKAS